MDIDSIKRRFNDSLLEGVAREGWVLTKHGAFLVSRGFGLVDRVLVRRYLRAHPVRKLNIGSGLMPLEGWLNADVFPVGWSTLRFNATRRFPFREGVFDYVFSEHMIEHITYPQGERMVRECFRVLRPGGTLRISTPDLGFLVRLYGGERTDLVRRYLRFHWEVSTPWAPSPDDTFFINHFVRAWRHQFIYDEKVLRRAMEQAGFVNIVQCELGESVHAALCGIENERRMPEGFVRLETFTLEGTKPGRPAAGRAG